MLNQNQFYENPVQRGFFPDPSVIRVGDDFYMVNSSFQYFPAIPISHSKDMVHWKIIGHAITNNEWLDLSNIPDSHGIWAPDISYYNGTFYIFATLRLNGDGKRGNDTLRRQLVVTAKNPAGPWSQPSWLEVDDIDPSHFVDEIKNPDGSITVKHYMMIAAGVRAVELSDDCTKVVGEPKTVWAGTGARCPEGPHILKKDGYYYAILAEGGTGYGHRISVARSTELFGTYEESPYNPVMTQTDENALIQRCGHGKLVQSTDGTWWCYYLCGRKNGGKFTTCGRESALDPVTFTEDGWFKINDGKGPSSKQYLPLPEKSFSTTTQSATKTQNNIPQNHILFSDDFSDNQLNKEWQFVRNPYWGNISLTERKNHLRIWTCDGQLFERRAKNTLLHREPEHYFQCITTLEFYPTKDGEQAGLTSYYSTNTYIRFSLCYEQQRCLQLVVKDGTDTNSDSGEKIIAQINNIPEEPIHLRIDVEGQCRSFYWKTKSASTEDWNFVEKVPACTFLCDEGVPSERKRHTGTLTGLYANNGGCGSRINADFSNFKLLKQGSQKTQLTNI